MGRHGRRWLHSWLSCCSRWLLARPPELQREAPCPREKKRRACEGAVSSWTCSGRFSPETLFICLVWVLALLGPFAMHAVAGFSTGFWLQDSSEDAGASSDASQRDIETPSRSPK